MHIYIYMYHLIIYGPVHLYNIAIYLHLHTSQTSINIYKHLKKSIHIKIYKHPLTSKDHLHLVFGRLALRDRLRTRRSDADRDLPGKSGGWRSHEDMADNS